MFRFKPAYHSVWAIILGAGISACEREDNTPAVPKVDVMMMPATDTLPPVIAENTLLTNTHIWYIRDWVYVANDATLTIEPGTVIQLLNRKDTGSGLVITRGAKIIAAGQPNWPIIFQMNDKAVACDNSWSGIVLLGRTPQKKIAGSKWAYGGEQPDDSSGVLRHVRIVKTSCAHTGLLLLGTGHRTVVEDVVTDTAANSPYRIEGLQLK